MDCNDLFENSLVVQTFKDCETLFLYFWCGKMDKELVFKIEKKFKTKKLDLYEDEEQFLPAEKTFIISIEFNPKDESFNLSISDKKASVAFVKQKNKCPEQDNYFIATEKVTIKYSMVGKEKLQELLECNKKELINKIISNGNYIPISRSQQAECGYFIKLKDFLIDFSSQEISR